MARAPLLTSLRSRAAAGVLLALAAAMSFVFVLQYGWLRAEMIERVRASAAPLSDVVKAGLEHAMQTRDRAALDAILAEVRAHEGVVGMFVVDKAGVIRISTDARDVGRRLPRGDPTCQVCHAVGRETRNRTVVFTTASGERVFRNVNPIANGPACTGCHEGGGALNGVLITDLSMRAVDRGLVASRRDMLIVLGVAMAVAGLAIAFVLDRLVIARLRAIGLAIARLASGRHDLHVPIGVRDEVGAVAAAFNEMTDRLRQASAVRERQELLESVLSHVADAVLVFAPDGSLLTINGAGERTVAPASRVVLLALSRRTEPCVTELTLHGVDGRPFPARVHVMPLRGETSAPLATVAVVQDLTAEQAREELHAQLARAEQLAAVGRLAASVAHELNNPLGNLLMYATLLREDSDDPQLREANTARIVDNALRCKAVVRSLLEYARPATADQRWADINALVRGALLAVGPDIAAHHTRCEARLADDLPAVWCDAHQVEQVIVNLLQNAIQAMADAGAVAVFTEADGADAVIVGVEDDGPGVPEDAAARVFEPFYTTKVRGTGLGLSICHGIVERHHGRIWTERHQDGPRPGSRFLVRLPVSGGQS